MTPSDEAVERGAKALNDRILAGSQGASWAQLDESEREHWRRELRSVLDAAFPSGPTIPEGYSLVRTDRLPPIDLPSGEYQRAVSDVVEALREFGKSLPVEALPDTFFRAADFIEQRFAPTSEGEE